MQSSYVPLNQYYRNQYKSSEGYDDEYNVGKFELSRSTDKPPLVKVSHVDQSISNITPTTWMSFNNDILLDAENIPIDAEIKSVDVFMRYGDNFWAPTIQPFVQQSITFDKTIQKIRITKPNMAFIIQSRPSPYESPTCNKTGTTPCAPFARVYITWG
jgi:hypothetical protein